MQDIHPNLPLIKFPIFTILDWLILSIFIGIIIYAWQSKKIKKTSPSHSIKKPKIIEKFSLSKDLQALKKLQTQKNWKAFVLQATKTLKKILTQKYQQQLSFTTKQELINILKDKVSVNELAKFYNFFQLIDPVKFANQTLTDTTTNEILNFLETFKKTK
jgi:hypothetical protein